MLAGTKKSDSSDISDQPDGAPFDLFHRLNNFFINQIYFSHKRILVSMLLSIIFAHFVAVAAVYFIGDSSFFLQVVIDTVIIILVVFPLLYFLPTSRFAI